MIESMVKNNKYTNKDDRITADGEPGIALRDSDFAKY